MDAIDNQGLLEEIRQLGVENRRLERELEHYIRLMKNKEKIPEDLGKDPENE